MLNSRTKRWVNAYAAGITIMLFMTSCTHKKINSSPRTAKAPLSAEEPEITAASPLSSLPAKSESPSPSSMETSPISATPPQISSLPGKSKPQSLDEEDEGWISASFGAGGSSKTSFDGQSGEYSYTRSDLALDLSFLSISYSRYDFSWTDAKSLDFANGATDPWSELQTLSLSTSIPYQIRDNLGLMTNLGVNMGWEEDTSNALSYDLSVGLLWEKSSSLKFMAGLAYGKHPDLDLRNELFPMFGVSWNEGVEKGWSASFGFPSTELRYTFSRNSSLALGLSGDGGSFRLSDNSLVAPKGYAEWNQFGVGLNFFQKLGKQWTLEAGATYNVDDEWRFFNADGTRISTKDADSSFGLNIRLNWRF